MTAQAWLRALGDKDTSKACSLTAYGDQPLAGNDLVLCRSGFDAAVDALAGSGDLDKLRAAVVTGAQVNGDHATVRSDQVTGVPAAYQTDLSLVLVSGTWYVQATP